MISENEVEMAYEMVKRECLTLELALPTDCFVQLLFARISAGTTMTKLGSCIFKGHAL